MGTMPAFQVLLDGTESRGMKDSLVTEIYTRLQGDALANKIRDIITVTYKPILCELSTPRNLTHP